MATRDRETISRMIAVHVLPIGSGFIAATRLGGITIRGPRRDSQLYAVQGLFTALAGSSDDASIALDLMLADEDFDERLAMLTDGKGTTPHAE